jgi:hypothetical protein
MGKSVLPEPGPWIDAVDRIGLGGVVILILALGVGISIPFRGPAYIDAINRVLQTFLKHSREKKRVPQKVKDKQQNLKAALSARKRNGGPK